MKQPFWKQIWFLVTVPLALMLCLLLLMFFRDVDPIDPPEYLRYEFPNISDEDNFYVDLLAAEFAIDTIRRTQYSLDETNEAELFKFITETEADIDPSIVKLRQAIFDKSHFLSFEPNSFNDALAFLSLWRAYFRYEAALMRFYASQGKWIQVAEVSYRLSVFCVKVKQFNSYIEGLVYVASENIYKSALNSILDKYEPPKAFLEKSLANIQHLPDWRELYRSSLRGELNFFKKSIRELANKPSSFKSFGSHGHEDLMFKLVRINVFYNETIPFFDYWCQAIDHPIGKLGTDPLVMLENRKNDYWFLITHREALLQLMILPALGSGSKKFRTCQIKRDLLSLRLAAHLFHESKNSYPKSMSDLVPRYLEVIPQDHFGSGKLQYLAKQELFYSVGVNGVDDGGTYNKKSRNFYANEKYDMVRPIGAFPELEVKKSAK